MIDFRLRLGVSCTCKMLSQSRKSGILPVVSENFIILRGTHFFNLHKNHTFCCTTSAQVAKIVLAFGSPRNQSFYSTRPAHVAKISLSETNDSHIASRVSRVARTEAQDALFDYLHCTRSLQFTDAEHISKNSPAFLQNLLSKVGDEQDIRRALSRFLRYHPINEFEPFFESMGLRPSEFSPLLPRNLMFLTDNKVLLENFHVLCNYGIPRSKIGKMYKEAKEVFGYDSVVLSSKLQEYEKLGLSKSMVIKFVTCCPLLLIGGVNEVLIRVMEELKCLGIEHEWIGEHLSEKNNYQWDRIFETLGFLNEMGCCKKDFARLLKRHPHFLFDDSGMKIYLLVALLLKLGLEMNEILSLLLHYPRVLSRNFSKNLWHAIHFLSELGMETEDIVKIVRTHPHVLGTCTYLKRPKELLQKLNMGLERLCNMIKEDPCHLTNLASRSKTSLLRVVDYEDNIYLLEKTNFLLKMGYVENSDEMTKALKQFRGRGDLLQDRFNCLVDAGLNFHDVCNMIRVAPSVLNQSREVIEMKIDHLVNCLCYPLESVIPFPTYLCYDIERIKLRFSMYKWLSEKGVVKSMMALSTILACSEARFVKHLVCLHSEGPDVWERLKNTPSSN
eukprot:TRINITY_DN7023_c0_g2_i1.p1 TRINITY_DN7023_c0_g2~~TRINITY_DN7023_c0_g2_i1.p1  ORF type:complete len:615 (-),score=79.09 TRINITY_DN7023_c0_g2_i1:37-1881(-)